MAIAYINSGGSASASYSFNCTGADILFVSVGNFNQTGSPSVTYNGVSMTFIAEAKNPGALYASMFYLVAPTTGSNTLAVTGGGASIAVCYSGAKQTGQPDTSTTRTGSGSGSQGTSVTTSADNCWSIFTGYESTNTTYTNATERQHIASSYFLGDSNGVITPAGSYSQAITLTGGGAIAMVQVAFAPAVSATNGNFFNFM